MQKSPSTIKTMKLYQHVERVERELAARGLTAAGPLDPGVLEPLDQLHYHGSSAVREAARQLGLDAESSVIDVGSGLGGPARVLASETGCHVTAVELQPDLHALAGQLTRRCGLDHRIDHRCGDFLDGDWPDSTWDALVSWLTFLHIPDRGSLLKRCHDCLRPGGRLFVEDFFTRSPLTTHQQALLAEEVHCRDLPDRQSYLEQIEAAGLALDEVVDLSEQWTAFVASRLAAFQADHRRYTDLHGEPTYQALDRFYSVIVELFESGCLGGIRWTARRPA